MHDDVTYDRLFELLFLPGVFRLVSSDVTSDRSSQGMCVRLVGEKTAFESSRSSSVVQSARSGFR